MNPIPYLAGAAIVISASAMAAEPSKPLDETLAAKLINLKNENRTPDIKIAMILEGSSAGEFQTKNLSRVTSIHGVAEGGAKVRQIQTYIFNWTPTYGWFLWESRQERGGEAVWIWSETLGEVIVR